MTAMIATAETAAKTAGIAGTAFAVPLAADGAGPPTHWGCNWVDCPPEVAARVADCAGSRVAPDWFALCAEMGLERVRPDLAGPGAEG